MVSDKEIMASVGPQMSGVGKAMSPILSSGNLATITPSSTNPDITDPKFASQYIPNGKPVYFRTVATDAYQGPSIHPGWPVLGHAPDRPATYNEARTKPRRAIEGLWPT